MALRDCKFERTYKTDEVGNDGMGHFYQAALKNSIKWRAASGYFTSSFLELFKKEVLQFVIDGGKIELVCSQVLKEDDIEKIENGYLLRYSIYNEIIETVLQEMIDNEDHKDAIGFLATLIKFEKLDIKINFYKDKNGIMHIKSGYFSDKNNKDAVAYNGSGNLTYMGAGEEGNFETHDVFNSWDETDRYQDKKELVDELWENKRKNHEVIDFPEVAKDRLRTYSKNDLAELDTPNIKKNNYSSASQNSDPGTKVALKKSKLDNLFPYQEETIENWYKNSQRGIIKHATGVGKTITALKIVYDHMEKGKPVLIIVPTDPLQAQWHKEIRNEISNASVVLCGGKGNNKWKNMNFYHMLKSTVNNNPGLIIISVVKTATENETFQNKISNNLSDALLVVDEVHHIATKNRIKILDFQVESKLGLSATPDIYNDDDNYYNRIIDYFGGIIEPKIELKDAIWKYGRLSFYEYHPNFLYLTESEEDEWLSYTKRIKKLRGIKNSSKSDSNKIDQDIKLLLIQRARIVKTAENKATVIPEILEKYYLPGQSWLIYCQEDTQLSEAKRLVDECQIEYIFQYTSKNIGNRDVELDNFKNMGGVLLAVNCLDEGIDIPQITHAIILASSKNPRQFVQRRGRVLRKGAGNKSNAHIYDCFIEPKDNYEDFDGIMRNEMKRAEEMADAATNKDSSLLLIRERLDLLIENSIEFSGLYDENEENY